MATLTVGYYSGDFDIYSLDSLNLSDGTIVSSNSTQIDEQFSNGDEAVLTGAFDFSSEDALLNSTVTGISLYAPSGLLFSLGDFNLTFNQLDALPDTTAFLSGNDTIIGNVGADILTGFGGNNTLEGEGVSDTLDYSRSPGSVTINFSTGTASNGYGGTDTFTNFWIFGGSPEGGTFIGGPSSSGETYYVNGGNNVVYANGGVVTLNYTDAPGPITVNFNTDTVINGFGGTDSFSGLDSIYGSPYGSTFIFGNTFTGTNDTAVVGVGSNNTIDCSNAPSAVYAAITPSEGYVVGANGSSLTYLDVQTIEGSPFDDYFAIGPGGGMTVLGGGGGTDTASFYYPISDYTVTRSSGNEVVVTQSPSLGTSSPTDLFGIRLLKFQNGGAMTFDYPNVPSNFYGTGTSDILWRNTDGTVGLWEMSGGQVLAETGFGQVDSSWQIAGTGDFNGDGRSDILWQNTNGTVGLWEMNGSQILSETGIGQADPSWQIAATGDFNGDGLSDILWRNTNGTIGMWLMNGTQIQSEASLGQVDSSWQIAGTGDFFGNGMDDILWQNSNGTVAMWQMNGTQVQSETPIGQAGNGWQVAGIGDFNGDGMDDVLLTNNSNGAVALWEMNGTQIASVVNLGQAASGWQVAGVGDYSVGGKADILWHNTDGTTALWQMNGTQIAAETVIGQPSTSWHIA
jgi:hypothetical protein